MKQLLTRIDDDLATAVKHEADLAGQSVNTYVTGVLRAAATGRDGRKAALIAAGKLARRGIADTPPIARAVSTPAGYASDLVSTARDER